MRILQRWKQTALHNKALVLTGVIVAIGTLVYTGAAVFQYCLMKQAAKESSAQIDKIIAEARHIAATAKDGLEQSKRALDASIEISRRDQRAWVGMVEILPQWLDSSNKPIFLKEGSHYKVGVTIVNSGKTPALKVRPKIRILPFSAKDKFFPNFSDIKGQPSVGVIQPLGKYKIISKPSYGKISASDLELLKNGSLILYLYGEIQYEDIFGEVHQTTFCSTLASTLDRFDVCSSNNDAN